MNALELLQYQLGIKSDGIFGKGTLKAVTKHFELSNVRAAHFFGQLGHETGDFKIFTENLNYSKEGLLKIFKKYFTPEEAALYERKPEMIANRVYANRMNNGPESSGDGWKFRGRGAIQLTGRDNYTKFATWKKDLSIIENPDVVASKYAFESAMYFFDINRLWSICDVGVDDDTITKVTKKINGGSHGLEDRKEKTIKYYYWLTD